MHRLLSLLLCSLIIYMVAFTFLFKKPLTVEFCLDAYKKKKAYMSKCNGRKIVIVAGSNGLFSHSAKVIEEETKVGAINYSALAELGVELILEKAKEVLNDNDIVILPLEYGFYNQDEREVIFCRSGNNYIFQYDQEYLTKFGIKRMLACIFSFDVEYAISALIEEGLYIRGEKRKWFNVDLLNENGDMTGHTKLKAVSYTNYKWHLHQVKPKKNALVQMAFSDVIIREFLLWCKERNISVYGSLPTTFNDEPTDPNFLSRIKNFYYNAGQKFIELDNHSQYPRDCFYDTNLHLNSEAQRIHSMAIARFLKRSEDLDQ